MKIKKFYEQKFLIGLIWISISNFSIALIGLIVFLRLNNTVHERFFCASFIGAVMIYNLIRYFVLYLRYQGEKEKYGEYLPPFKNSYEVGQKALSNNIPDLMEDIKKKNADNAKG
jgi:hypothetical protein